MRRTAKEPGQVGQSINNLCNQKIARSGRLPLLWTNPAGEGEIGNRTAMPTTRSVADLLDRQHGLITLGQCRERGMSHQEVRARVRTGAWRRVRRGAYVDVAHWPADAHGQLRVLCHALLLMLPAGTVVSHRTAAALWRLESVTDDPHEEIHVTVPRGAAPIRVAGCRGHSARAEVAVRVVSGVPVTTLARTVLDVARSEALSAAVVAADSALAADPRLDLVGELLRCSGWPGYRQAAFVVRFADGRAESALESLARLLWHESGLPPPKVQADIAVRGRFLARVDFLWPAAKLVVEVDGMGKYAEPGELAREKRRQNALVRAGYRLLRFTWADVVHRPAATAATVRAMLAATAQAS